MVFLGFFYNFFFILYVWVKILFVFIVDLSGLLLFEMGRVIKISPCLVAQKVRKVFELLNEFLNI